MITAKMTSSSQSSFHFTDSHHLPPNAHSTPSPSLLRISRQGIDDEDVGNGTTTPEPDGSIFILSAATHELQPTNSSTRGSTRHSSSKALDSHEDDDTIEGFEGDVGTSNRYDTTILQVRSSVKLSMNIKRESVLTFAHLLCRSGWRASCTPLVALRSRAHSHEPAVCVCLCVCARARVHTCVCVCACSLS